MVSSCSAFGCTNRYDKNVPIQFHKYPLKKPELLSKWVSQTNRKNFTPTLYSRLCSEHFVAEDYQIRPGASVKLLKDDAFPSVFKSAPGHLQKKLLAKHKRLAILQTHTVTNDQNTSNFSTSSSSTQCINSLVDDGTVEIIYTSELLNHPKHKNIQCELRSPTEEVLRKEIKVLKQRLKRQDLKIKSLISQLHNREKKPVDWWEKTQGGRNVLDF